jgi:hypothetical protein
MTASMEFDGCLDRCDAECIAGWAMFPHGGERKATIDIYSGTLYLGRCVADQYRRDLDEAGLANGHCAFTFAMPADLSPPDVIALRAIIPGTGYMFVCGVQEPVLDVEIDRIYHLGETGGTARAKRFRTCILHIGCEKTGSTTLQKFLHGNRERLAHAGYFVPLSLAPAPHDRGLNHACLPTLAMDDRAFGGDLRDAAGISDARALLAYRQAIFAGFRDEVAGAPADADTLILSSEHCHSRLCSVQSIRHLRQFLEPFCETFRIVVYLRPQHEVAISFYGMFLLAGDCTLDMFPPLVPPPGYGKIVHTPPSYFDYAALLDRWARVFGEDAVDPRLFDTATLRSWDIIDDFSAGLGLPSTELVRPPAQNTNISAAAQHFLMRLHAGGCGDGLSPAVRAVLSDLLRARFPGGGVRPARRDAEAFFAQFTAGNEAVRARWFPRRQSLFACDFSDYPAQHRAPGPQHDRIFQQTLLEAKQIAVAANPPRPPKARSSPAFFLRTLRRRRAPH